MSHSGPSDTDLPCPQQIMKDKWINIGYEGEELKPYTEPEEDFGDTKRIGESQGSRFRRLWCSAAEPRLPSLPLLLGSILSLSEGQQLRNPCTTFELCNPKCLPSLCVSSFSRKWQLSAGHIRGGSQSTYMLTSVPGM